MNLKPRSEIHVLVVEDDLEIRQTIGEILTDEGYRVTLAAHGRAALSYLNGSQVLPSVILLDLMMPTMNGWEFRAEQLRVPALAAIPVVVMSAHGGVAAGALSAAAVLHKPLDVDDLLRTVAALGV